MYNAHKIKRIANTAWLSVVCLTITACAGMTEQEKNTAIGAGVGAVGGVIGHEIKK